MRSRLFDAVLFDRDGTLVRNVPYNGDPALVEAVPGAREALDRLRRAGLRLGVVTNQSGIARGLLTVEDVSRVNARVEHQLGPFDTWQVCRHGEADGCRCRKPAPGLIVAAARALETTPERCIVVGDIGSDMVAAGAAGASGILVPTPATEPDEVAAAPAVAGDLPHAVDQILRRQRLLAAGAPGRAHRHTAHRHTAHRHTAHRHTVHPDTVHPGTAHRHTAHRHTVLVARPDSAGDVLVTGPAIRAVAAGAGRVVMLCGPRGRAATELLPGVDELIECRLPWIDPQPSRVDLVAIGSLVSTVAAAGVDEAVIFTSFHQSALPLALVLRMAGVERISAISDDYPGSLLDVRHRVPLGIPEPERALSLAAAAGYPPPDGDELALRLRAGVLDHAGVGPAEPGYVTVHPGTSVPARACPPRVCTEIVTALAAAGKRVVVTGGPQERDLTAAVAGRCGMDLGGQTSLAALAAVIARAGCLVTGNTGPAHLAAATGTPVVSLFAPTVPFGAWGPWRVPCVRLGDPTAQCRQTRAATCPVPGHPCLSTVEPATVVEAVGLIEGGRR